MSKNNNLFANLKSDFASGLVVFLVALPLCLGIAMASGAPLFSGIISGVIGGIVVGYISQSHISVSGPAAGLTAIVLTAITDLGAFDVFLTAVFIAGLFQLALGFLKAGTISNYFPTNVIEGMLAGIGIIIIMKQLPHAVGFDSDFEGDQSFIQADGSNTFSSLTKNDLNDTLFPLDGSSSEKRGVATLGHAIIHLNLINTFHDPQDQLDSFFRLRSFYYLR
jgi:MFS superfamily sulfate permease-like transporter